MKKLLIFHPFLATYRIDLYNYLSIHFNLFVYLWYGKIKPSSLGFDLGQVNELATFPYLYEKHGWIIRNRTISIRFYKIIRNFSPNIVIAHEFGINTIISVLMHKISNFKLYVTCDDSPDMVCTCKGIRKKLRTFCINHIDGLIVVHPDVINYLNKHYKNKKCKYFYLPIIQDDKTFRKKLENAIPNSDYLLHNKNLISSKVVIYVGRLENVKSVDILIKAFNLVVEEDPNTKLVIVGDGSLSDNLKMLVRDLDIQNYVFFCGKLSGNDLYSWYNIGQIFVLPSKFEPFGAVVNEALMAGCFTIVSDKVGANCLINSQNGNIFTSENQEELSEILIKQLKVTPLIEEVKCKENKMNLKSDEIFNNLATFISNAN